MRMKYLLAALATAAAASSAAAQSAPDARIEALLSNTGSFAQPLALPAAPSAAPPAAALAPAPVASGALVPPGLWSTLSAPDSATLAWLGARIPGLDLGRVRVLTFADADAIFATAADRRMSPLDVFSDSAFRGAEIYYIPKEVIVEIFARYEIRVLTPISGTSTDGRPFSMQALVLGGGRVESLYDLSDFDANNPMFPDYTYKFSGRVTETINGPGDLGIQGVWVRDGFFTPRIERIVKISPTEGRVETNYGSRVKPVMPISRR